MSGWGEYMKRDREFWIQMRSVQYASDIPAMMERIVGFNHIQTDKLGLRCAWDDAAPGDFLIVRGANDEVNHMADILHLDVLETWANDSAMVIRKPRKTRNVVCTILVGEEFRRYPETKMMVATARAYADRIDADFRVIRVPPNGFNLYFSKFRIAELLDEYERVIYLDADMLVMPGCPDLFSVVPQEYQLGGYIEGWCRPKEVEAEWKAIVNVLGSRVSLDEYLSEYINTGLFVASRCHRKLFEMLGCEDAKKADDGLVQADFHLNDQPLMNWGRAVLNIPLWGLHPEFNLMVWHHPGANRFRANVIHYADNRIKWLLYYDMPLVMDMYIEGRELALKVGISQGDL